MNDPRHLNAQQQAQLEAQLREEALARAQARLNAEAAHQQQYAQSAPLAAGRPQVERQPVPEAVPPVQETAPVIPPQTTQSAHSTRIPQPAAPQDGALDFIGGERDVMDFIRADRHSGAVRFLRIALPLAGVFILSVVVGAYWWSLPSTPSVSVQSAGIEDGKMVMRNPELNGVDEKQRPYSLVAKEVIQDPSVPNEVELSGIDAKVPMEEGLFARILAGKGFYDSEAKTLKLDQEVDIKTDDGMSMTLKDADIDMDAGNLLTSNPVSILTEQAKISADSLTVENNGEKVIFENRVRMTLYPEKIQEAQQQAKDQAVQ